MVVDRKKGLAAFLPPALKILNSADENVVKTQRVLDSEFQFNLLVVQSCLTNQALPVEELDPYLADLKVCLRRTLHAEDVVVNGMARRILGLTISGLTKERMSGSLFRDKEDKSVEAGFQPYRQWAKPCRPWEVDPVWIVPTEASVDVAQAILDEFLGREIETLEGIIKEFETNGEKSFKISTT